MSFRVPATPPSPWLSAPWGRRPVRLDIDPTGDTDLWGDLDEVLGLDAVAWG